MDLEEDLEKSLKLLVNNQVNDIASDAPYFQSYFQAILTALEEPELLSEEYNKIWIIIKKTYLKHKEDFLEKEGSSEQYYIERLELGKIIWNTTLQNQSDRDMVITILKYQIEIEKDSISKMERILKSIEDFDSRTNRILTDEKKEESVE